ncbi:MAG TPA: tail fiber protein [Myxococcota bacterium]|nr:tail fiber protein [Myxococcota bacterium]
MAQLMLTGANFCPQGWAPAEGQLLPINTNQALFSLLGTTNGGNGQTNFALPDLRGRAPIHQGQGPGLTNRTLGEQGGVETVTLLQSEMPAHAHALLGTTQGADAASPTGAALATKARTTLYRADGAPDTTLHGGSIASAGGSQPHANMPPYLVMRWCIALQGIFPTQSFAAELQPAAVVSEPDATSQPEAERRPRSRRFGR